MIIDMSIKTLRDIYRSFILIHSSQALLVKKTQEQYDEILIIANEIDRHKHEIIGSRKDELKKINAVLDLKKEKNAAFKEYFNAMIAKYIEDIEWINAQIFKLENRKKIIKESNTYSGL